MDCDKIGHTFQRSAYAKLTTGKLMADSPALSIVMITVAYNGFKFTQIVECL